MISRRLFVYFKTVADKHWLFLGLIVVGAYLLTIRQVEPGIETQKSWFANRLLLNSDGFPLFSHGPLYSLYVGFFKVIDLPWSVIVEYWVTHLFCYCSLYLLTNRFCQSKIVSLAYTCAWIPFMSYVESANTVFAIGFACFYYKPVSESYFVKREILPLPLLAALLSQSVFLVFWIGHVFAYLIQIRQHQGKVLNSSCQESRNSLVCKYWKSIAKSFLLILALLCVCFPAQHHAYNHNCFEEDFIPEPAKSGGIIAAFFQIYTHIAVTSDNLGRSGAFQDWYLTVPNVWGEATGPISAYLNNPGTFTYILKKNLKSLLYIPSFFLGSLPIPGFWLVSCLIFLGSSIALARLKIMQLWSIYFVQVIVSTTGILSVITLTWFNPRYFIVLLPIALLQTYSIAMTAQYGIICLISRWNVKKVIGIALILKLIYLPIVISHTSMQPVYLDQYSLEYLAVIISYMMVMSILGLMYFCLHMSESTIRKVEYILTKIRKVEYTLPKNSISKFTIFLVSIMVLVPSITYNLRQLGKSMSIVQYLYGEYLLHSPNGLLGKEDELLDFEEYDTKILVSNELPFVASFADINLAGIHTIFILPPHDGWADATQFLSEFDEIWLRNSIDEPTSNVSTQVYPRYLFYIKPFLELMDGNGWRRITIEGYGEKFVKIK